jgi:hypothetical protein
MQAHIADLDVPLPKLDPDVREHAGGGHEDLLWLGLGRQTNAPRSGCAKSRQQAAATQSLRPWGDPFRARTSGAPAHSHSRPGYGAPGMTATGAGVLMRFQPA